MHTFQVRKHLLKILWKGKEMTTHLVSARVPHVSKVDQSDRWIKTLKGSVRWWNEPVTGSLANSILGLALGLGSVSDLRQCSFF